MLYYTIELMAAILPAVFLGLYVWKKDTKKEPTWQLIKAVLIGMAICVPVVVVEMLVQSYLYTGEGHVMTLLDTTINAFCVAAIPEESFKLLALWLVLRRNPYFDEHFDGIVYAVCVGLGFATVENIGYVLGQEQWVSVAITRSLLAVPGHYAFAVLMGYFYSVYHFVDRSPKTRMKIWLMPVLAHGTYDALAMSGEANMVVGGISFIVLIFFCIKMQKFANQRLNALVDKDKRESVFTWNY